MDSQVDAPAEDGQSAPAATEPAAVPDAVSELVSDVFQDTEADTTETQGTDTDTRDEHQPEPPGRSEAQACAA
jgi:hypothetical protein